MVVWARRVERLIGSSKNDITRTAGVYENHMDDLIMRKFRTRVTNPKNL